MTLCLRGNSGCTPRSAQCPTGQPPRYTAPVRLLKLRGRPPALHRRGCSPSIHPRATAPMERRWDARGTSRGGPEGRRSGTPLHATRPVSHLPTSPLPLGHATHAGTTLKVGPAPPYFRTPQVDCRLRWLCDEIRGHPRNPRPICDAAMGRKRQRQQRPCTAPNALEVARKKPTRFLPQLDVITQKTPEAHQELTLGPDDKHLITIYLQQFCRKAAKNP